MVSKSRQTDYASEFWCRRTDEADQDQPGGCDHVVGLQGFADSVSLFSGL